MAKNIGLLLMVIIVGFLAGCNQPSEAEQVYAKCQEAVEGELIAPTTAVFPPVSEVEIFRMGSGTLNVSGRLDSENSFSAMVRSTFRCSMDENMENVEARVTTP